MVQLIENLTKALNLGDEIFFISLGVMDRYLAVISVSDTDYPSLVNLSMVSLVLACKFMSIFHCYLGYQKLIKHL